MAERKPLPGWVPQTSVSQELRLGGVAKAVVFHGDAEWWWEFHESGDAWPFTNYTFGDQQVAQLAAEDAARAMVADMARALGLEVVAATAEGAGHV